MRINFQGQITIYLLSMSIILFVTFFLLIKGRKTPLLYSFIAFQYLVFLWLLRVILLKISIYRGVDLLGGVLLTSMELYELTHYKLKYYIECIMGLCWLIFCMFYTKGSIKKNKAMIILIILLAPVIFYLPVMLYDCWPKNASIFKSVFLLRNISKYIYFCIGVGIIIKASKDQEKQLKKQSLLLVAAIFIPNALNFFQDYKRYILCTGGIIYNFDITPIGFVAAMLFIAFAAYRYRFLDVMPIALRKLINHINEGVIFIDSLNVIIDYNKHLEVIFQKLHVAKKNVNIDMFLKEIEGSVIQDNNYHMFVKALNENEASSFKGELRLLKPKIKYISAKVDLIHKMNNKIIGRVICFTDVTEYKNLISTINDKNYELTVLNMQLEEYAAAAEELAVTKERNRLARDIHDTLGHTMTVLISLLEVTSITCSDKDEVTYKRLREATYIARDGLRELRRSIEGLSPKTLEHNYLVQALQKLIQNFRNLGIDIELAASGVSKALDPTYTEAIYRIIQEAVTNAIRHGNANHIDIIIKFNSERIKIFIIDNGYGCKHVVKGFGLLGMEQRVSSLKGNIIYGSDGERGFNIRMEIPLDNLKN